MLNFDAFRNKQISLAELVAPLGLNDLRDLTHEMVGQMEALLENGRETDVAFQPVDPAAHDRFATQPDDLTLPWTLGHIIAHTTATSEESAAVAAELARGVPFHGRSRFEVPWQTLTTLSACRQRLAESRRMRLASLEMWPTAPHLDNLAEIIPSWPPLNAPGRFVLGLMHDDSHLAQMGEVLRQAEAARATL
jgi:DinB superfamily